MEPEQSDGSDFNARSISEICGRLAKNKIKQTGTAESAFYTSLRIQTRERSAKVKAAKAIFLALRPVCAVGVLLTSTLAAQASPLSAASFEQLASVCAPGVKITTLWAVAWVESHFESWALRDNNSRQTWKAQSLSAAINLAQYRIQLGHSVDLGLMQINSRILGALGIGVADAFDPCRSLAAASQILLTDYKAPSADADKQAATLIALSRYNTGRPLAGIANGYTDQVVAAQYAHLDGDIPAPMTPKASPKWDIWGTSTPESAAWFITADGLTEIESAGAQSTNARTEGRAAVPPLAKGEPYELFAYQESEPIKP